MITFAVSTPSPHPPRATLAALLDLDRHTQLIPLTTVHHDGTGLRIGSEFTARTTIGPIGFDDRMRVVLWQQPAPDRVARVLIEKIGRLLRGRIEILIRPTDRGARVEWRQELIVAGLPRLFEPLGRAIARSAYARMLSQLLERRR